MRSQTIGSSPILNQSGLYPNSESRLRLPIYVDVSHNLVTRNTYLATPMFATRLLCSYISHYPDSGGAPKGASETCGSAYPSDPTSETSAARADTNSEL
eukprot:scaffold2841_cov327-Pinguiococcus_pyrenoidosus.AAC.1